MVLYWELLLVVILGDITTMGIFVLILNPRIGTKRIKSEIVDDDEFMHRTVKRIIDIVREEPEEFDPFISRIQEKIQGTILSDHAVDRMIDRTISREIRETNPEIDALIEVVSGISPRLGKTLKKRPELAPDIIRKLQERGILPDLSESQMEGIRYE